jgi:quinol-cytochrome oxidoreductase complex cytochrome b subunit
MPGIGEIITESQIWKSIFRHPMPVDRRNRIVVMLTNFFLHLHPVSIKQQGIALSYTWCMGGVTFFLFLVETVTGVLLMFYYRPTLEWAYNDILALRDVYSLGIMREIHRWGAHAMVITVWLHMYRVFLTGSYKPPREFNWVIGVILLLLTLLLSFTGYLLPWDQLAVWAITVGSNMARATPFLGHEGPGAQLLNPELLNLGGYPMITSGTDARFALLGARNVSEETLNRFYILHCIAIPLAVALLLAIHFWRVRKDGGISGPL